MQQHCPFGFTSNGEKPRGAAQQLLVGALWEIPGVFIGIALGMMYLRQRRADMKTYGEVID